MVVEVLEAVEAMEEVMVVIGSICCLAQEVVAEVEVPVEVPVVEVEVATGGTVAIIPTIGMPLEGSTCLYPTMQACLGLQ